MTPTAPGAPSRRNTPLSRRNIAIVEILRRIEPRFSELEVVDEGQYWESRDRELLVANLKALANLLDATEEALKVAPPGQGPLDERIIAAMSNLGRDIKPN